MPIVYPNKLNLKVLEPPKHLNTYNYAEEFAKLDLDAVKQDLVKVLTTSQDWWPADYGHYGPLMVRLAWHSAGTYRTFDGRGGGGTGNMRFWPLNSWPDNGNLDKARRLLWPIKQKYGKKLSWGDLMIFVGNVAMEDMGFKTFGFAGGREDIWAPEEDIHWGPENTFDGAPDERHAGGDKARGELAKPLGADQMGLIYVNPEGPGGNPDPLLASQHMRDTFGRMAMGDEETVALVAGGHTFGKAHGAGDPKLVGAAPEDGAMEQQGFGWKNGFGTGKGVDAITSGLEGAWTTQPTKWNQEYFQLLFKYEWEMTKSPAGATQWTPKDPAAKNTVPDAHDPKVRHAPVMFTTDLALKLDPVYAPISKRFLENPSQFEDAFARAWYKLCHRDMGPMPRLLGKQVPPAQLWQDPVPAVDGPLITDKDIAELKQKIMASGCSVASLVRTAWASASTYRSTDHRGGANGARVRLAPQNKWAANNPAELAQVLQKLEGIKNAGPKVSMADLIVLGGCAAVEAAAYKAGCPVKVPFTPGRTDASLEMTDVASFGVLEPTTDAFRNHNVTSAAQLVDKAQMLRLTGPEMTVLLGGMRVLSANSNNSQVGVLTKRPEVLTNDFFLNLFDMGITWQAKGDIFEGRDYGTGELKWTGSQADLVFGSNSELRAIAEYYSWDDSMQAFVEDFAAAWAKVMNLDRFDLK